VCGARECQNRRHQEADAQWHARHPDYDVARRLRALRERLERCRDPGEVVRQELPRLSALPAEEVREELGGNGLAILVILARLVRHPSQDEMAS
jgi:hypothetical protein